MLDVLSSRLRLFLKSELDLLKDRLLGELREDKAEAIRRVQREEFEARLQEMAHASNLTPDQVRRDFLIEGVELLNSLTLNVGAVLRVLEDGALEIQIGPNRFIPDSLQELGILKEVFVDEVYLTETPNPMYVWDVGANVATASLYFASVLGWGVSAYELFLRTGEIAKRNIERSGFSRQIELTTCGIGGKAEKLKLRYNDMYRGSNGLFGNTDLGDTGEGTMVDVEILDASEEIQRVLKLAAGRPLLAKFDCEGAEYDIIPRLIETGDMKSIAAIVMEEHVLPGKDREALVYMIRDAGFTVRRQRRLPKHVSMLFACKMGG